MPSSAKKKTKIAANKTKKKRSVLILAAILQRPAAGMDRCCFASFGETESGFRAIIQASYHVH